MSGIARAGDVFVGSCSQCDGATVIGFLLGDAATVTGEGKKIALTGGMGIGTCGHMTQITGGSGSVSIEGKKVATVGTQVANSISGIILSGSGTITVGG